MADDHDHDHDPDPDLTAGEYVLGTLDAAERRAFARRLMHDPAAVAAVEGWRRRFAPLDLAGEDVAPSAGLWPRIDRATGGGAANDNLVRRWRAATAAAALVALIASGIAWRGAIRRPVAPLATTAAASAESVAALTADGAAPALMVAYDRATHDLRVAPIALSDRPGHSLQLWMITPGTAPRPMVVMPHKGSTALRGIAIDPRTETLFAVSVEPIGGSPTGLPTGPVIYSGKLTDITGT